MDSTVCILLIGATLSAVTSQESCGALHHYRELNCSPVPGSAGTDACPQYFDCQQFHPIPDKCYYRGSAYSNGDLLPSDVVESRCSISCYCNVRKLSNNTSSTFECAAVDCVEDYSSGESEEEECIATYELNDCCSSGKVCGKNDISKQSTCVVDGITYREGQQFYPSNTCQVCVCTKEFNGTLSGASYCADINCGIEIHYQMELASNCAPVVLNKDSCCPHKWECPDNSTQIVEARAPSAVEATCKFGDRTLKVGDQVLQQDKCLSCSCQVPPLVTCLQQTDCSLVGE